MRRLLLVSGIAVGLAVAATAQVDRLETYQSSFASSNLQTKLEILRSAETEDPTAFGPLYGQALSYVVSNAEQLLTEQLLREIALISIDRIDQGGYVDGVNDLWRLFRLYEETSVRIEIVTVLGSLAGDSPQTIGYMDQWIQTQNNLTRAGVDVDLQVLASVVQALGALSSETSFPAVLEVILVSYPDFLADIAFQALGQLSGAPLEMSTSYMLDLEVQDRYEPLDFFVNSGYLSEADVLELSNRVLADTLLRRPQERIVQEETRRVRFFAASVLGEGGYGEATGALVRHFNETVLEFERDQVTRNRLIDAIASLGSMGTDDAAARLVEYLELLNTYTEIDRPYDTQIVLATIEQLRVLDRPSSYNALFSTSILENYPSRIKDASREAMRSVAQ